MPNCRAYILSHCDTLQPINTVGEICVAGDCLSKGYINLKDKTAEKFVYIPNINDTVYKTGDLGYFLPDGNIQYVGRKDNQIKINGYRIELEEINSILLENKNILESVSLVDNNKILSFILFLAIISL